MNKLYLAAVLPFLAWTAAASAAATVAIGEEIGIAYTASVAGDVVDTAPASDPVHFVVGTGNMMPGLEDALMGLHPGDETTVKVTQHQGYGEYDPDAVKRLSLSVLPADLKPEPGMAMEVRESGGESLKAVVKGVEGDRVVLDFNHPLAGKTLTFKVKVLSIGKPTEPLPDYPRAKRSGRTWPDLLKVNARGVVFPAVGRKRANEKDIGQLFTQIRADTDTALLQCGTQIVGIEVMGDALKTYSVLNTPTRATLQRLVDPGAGSVTEANVMAALLAPYAGDEERNRRGLACDLLLSPLAGKSENLRRQLANDVCPRIARLTACLADLHHADKEVLAQAGTRARRLYSGARWDSKIDFLDQFAAR